MLIAFSPKLGLEFLHQITAAKDPDAAFFKKLDGFQPCEINELKAGTHVFAVYGLSKDFMFSFDYYAGLVLNYAYILYFGNSSR